MAYAVVGSTARLSKYTPSGVWLLPLITLSEFPGVSNYLS